MIVFRHSDRIRNQNHGLHLRRNSWHRADADSLRSKLLSGSGKARGGILMLERPGDRFDARSFKVFHVIKEGALANAAENDGSDGVMYSGTTVLFSPAA